jgi:DNA repair exonuclease SbcCD nuclease subunit
MTYTFLHTADWQIGKRFGGFPGDKPAVLRDERLRAIDRLAAAAETRGCAAVLVAGDIFDSETLPPALCARLLSLLGAHAGLTWHLLPGNHDPARPGGIWSVLAAGGLPANVCIHLQPGPVDLAPGVVLLPSPLTSKRTSTDPTAWMDDVATPAGTLRIGLAHGSVQGFGSEGDANVNIDASRPKRAGLSYLALGDWHGTMRIGERVWYSGTPEPDGFRDNDPGNALLVRLDGNAAPQVERLPTAHYTWVRRECVVDGATALDAIEQEVTRLGGGASRCLMSLTLKGAVPLSEFAQIDARIDKLAPRLFHLATDMRGLSSFTDAADLEAMQSPALADIAQRLKAAGATGDVAAEVSERALRRLFALARQAEART